MRFFDRFRKDRTRAPGATPEPLSTDDLIAIWRRIIIGETKSWVLFRHGTCVIFVEPAPDLRDEALKLMREWGPVHVGSEAADFSVLTSPDNTGWVVTSHHPDILTFVAPDEIPAGVTDDLVVGVQGRTKRDQDAAELNVIHVEHRPSAA